MKNLLIISAIFLFANCRKVVTENGDLYIRGRVFVNDIITKEELTVNKTSVKVQLSTDKSETDFIYSVSPDAEGYFTFELPYKKKVNTYYVRASITALNDDFVSDFVEVTKEGNAYPQKTVSLYQDLEKKNYYNVFVYDSLNNTLPNSVLYFFTNPMIATNSFTTNASYTYTTSANGQFKLRGLAAGHYYVNAQAVYTNSLTLKRKLHEVTITDKGVQTDSLILYRR